MHILLKSWLDAFKIFSPKVFLGLIMTTGQRFWNALKNLFLHFKWLVVIDVIILSLVGNKLINILTSEGNQLSGFAIIVQFVTSIIWFVLGAAILLFAVMPLKEQNPLEFFKQMFLRYIQLSFFFMLLFLFSTSLLFSAGVTTLPQVPWILYSIVRHFEVLTILYWFNSSFTFKGIFGSVERAANFILYHLPLIAFSILLMWGFNSLMNLIFYKFSGIDNLVQLIANGTSTQELAATKSNLTITPVLLFKYLKYLLETIWLCFVFSLFEMKKDDIYSSEYFE